LSGITDKKKNTDDIDWENINEDDIDSDGELKQSPDIQFATGFSENIG